MEENKTRSKKAASTLHCICCDKDFNEREFYSSDSILFKSAGKIPYCKECIEKLYKHYLTAYKKLGYSNPDRKAVERMCMFLDIYYSNNVFDSVIKQIDTKGLTSSVIATYIKQIKLTQYKGKDYDTTISEKNMAFKDVDLSDQDEDKKKEIEAAIKIFGTGFENEDYLFLYEQYNDWTARHECNTKAQEEIFKNICFTQLEILKATRAKSDTKDLTATFQKLLETAKLQPKQNSGDTTADNQTFGTLIDKWENTRPIPEVEEDLRDVDKIGLYINVFFKGHLAKMMGLKNGLSKLYDKYMAKYTVEKPEYDGDEDNEALFDAIFGGTIEDDS